MTDPFVSRERSDERVDPRIVHTRRVVIEAAAALLSAEGFTEVTIDAIAARSGVARSTIYRHWPDRADLLVEAFEGVSSSVTHPDSPGPLCADLRERGRNLTRGLVHEPWGRILPCVVGVASHDHDVRRALDAFGRARRAETAEVFARAAQRGEISSTIDPVEWSERFAGPFFLRRLLTTDTIDDDFVEVQVIAICAGLGARYESAPSPAGDGS